MISFDVDPERDDAFLPETTEGLRLLVNRSESGEQNNVTIGLGDVRGRLTLELRPSHAKELARHLIQSATALDAEYPDQPNR